jgi:hypothetical protein
MSNQRSPNEDIQKGSDVEDRLITTTFSEATGWKYYDRCTATLPLNEKKKNRPHFIQIQTKKGEAVADEGKGAEELSAQ